jgi:hypothetical protein
MDLTVHQALIKTSINKLKFPFVRNSIVALSAIIAFAGPSLAQSADTVTFRFVDDEGITGELVEVNDKIARLKTTVGLITIPLEGASCIGRACPDSIRFVPTLPPVVLTALDGSTTLTGNLLEVTESQYVIATDFGEFSIDINKVSCEGEGCPPVANPAEIGGEVVLTSGSTTIEGRLIGLEESAYVVEVEAMGTIRVNSDLFTCAGEGCP